MKKNIPIPLLDIIIIKSQKSLNFKIYRKPTNKTITYISTSTTATKS